MEATQSTIGSLKKEREFFEGLGKVYDADDSVTFKKEQVGGVETYLFTPEQAISNKLIFYFHGGCYALGSINSHKALLTHLAARLQTAILHVEYALAPEKPYPHGVNDGLTVYKEVVKKEREVILMGDSAGGGIALSLLADLKQAGIVQPAGVIMLSPWLDLKCNNTSYTTNAESDKILSKANLEPYAPLYVGDNDLKKINPIDRILSTFPKNLIMVSESEILLDDSRLLHEKVKYIQSDSKLSIFPNQGHVWPLTDIDSDASRRVIEEIREFLFG